MDDVNKKNYYNEKIGCLTAMKDKCARKYLNRRMSFFVDINEY